MKLRTLVLAVAVLAALSVVAYLRNRPSPAPSADPRVGTVLLDADTVGRASGLVISDQGKQSVLSKGTDGSWRVTTYFDFPADVGKISQLVQDLNEAKVDRFVTSNPDRLAHLDFKDSSITLADASDKEIWSLTIGRESEQGNGRFIRFGAEPKAFYSTLHVWLDTDSKGWANAQLVDVKPDDIAKIEIPFDGGPALVASRAKKDAPWSDGAAPAGRKLSAEKMSSLLSSLTSLKFTDTVDVKDPAAAEAAPHTRTLKLTTFDGKTYTVALGRKPEERRLKTPVSDAKEGLASLGKLTDTKADVKPAVPEFDTIPAGPVFAAVSSSDAHAGINGMMKQRAFEVDEYVFTGLPQKPDDLLEAETAK
jgi:hypothetical protein